MSSIKFFDHQPLHLEIASALSARVDSIYQHGKFIMGEEVGQLEAMLADAVGTRHAIACANGTDALVLALKASLPSCTGEVITTAYSYFASCEVIESCGLTPRFVDIDPVTLNMDTTQIEQCINDKTVAILPVSLFGLCVDFQAIQRIADKHQLVVIEDGAQSFGATFDGMRSCGSSTVGCTSFFPTKVLGCYGDGGALFTNDDAICDRVRKMANHGQTAEAHVHDRIGCNSRLDTLQAAVLIEKMHRFDATIANRLQSAQRYDAALADLPVTTPSVREGSVSVYAQYTILTEQRDSLRRFLTQRNIPTAVYYPHTLPGQPAMVAKYGQPPAGSYPVAERATQQAISLPIYYGITPEQQQAVIDAMRAFFTQQLHNNKVAANCYAQ